MRSRQPHELLCKVVLGDSHDALVVNKACLEDGVLRDHGRLLGQLASCWLGAAHGLEDFQVRISINYKVRPQS